MPQATPLPCALVIDPDPTQQQTVAQALHPHFNVVWCANLADSFGMIRTHHPLLVLLELEHQPNDAFQWIAERRKEQQHPYLTIVCLTAHATVGEKVRAFQSGADDYLVKPIQTNTFLPHLQLLVRANHQQYD